MWLPQALIDDVSAVIDEVFYVPYAATRVFNTDREEGEPLVFSGWYWARGALEGGPFRSASAAYRDAWFRLVRKTTPPRLHKDAIEFKRKQNRSARTSTPYQKTSKRKSARVVKLRLVA
jgi:hypothetical protein